MPSALFAPLGSNATCCVRRATKYRVYQAAALVITFTAYVLLHAARKTFANVKPSLHDDWTDSMFGGDGDACERFFGVLDATFMFAYAGGLLVLAPVGDRFNMRWVLLVGMVGPAVPIGLFAAGSAYGVRVPAFYVVLWLLNGLLQALVWPSVVSVMGNWWGIGTRGLVMGLWSGNASAGNILGAVLTPPVLAAWGWEATFIVVGVLLVLGGLVCFAILAPHPADVGLPHLGSLTSWTVLQEAIDRADAGASERAAAGAIAATEDGVAAAKHGDAPKAISFVQAVLLPGVIVYALCYAAAKSVNYVLFFWLPYYLSNVLGWSNGDADSYSSLNDLGGIVGASAPSVRTIPPAARLPSTTPHPRLSPCARPVHFRGHRGGAPHG